MSQEYSLLRLHRFACFCVGSVIFLIVLGAIVTSKGAGLAVPDWPQSYGYNMFLFPYHRWVGGIFWEHSHRLVASGVGFLTIILMVWIWRKDPRSWMKKLGVFALVLVIVQGVLGGTRVVMLKDELGLIHGCLAQLFLATIGAIALFTSRMWWARKENVGVQKKAVRLVLITTIFVFIQLTLGASMRHAHRGLSIPDFPKAYGQWWPKISVEELQHINQQRLETGHPATSIMLIHMQMGHRVLAVIILVHVLLVLRRWGFNLAVPSELQFAAKGWIVLVMLQVVLGVLTIWTDRGFEVTSAHVAVGAAILLSGVLMVVYAGSLAGMWMRPKN